MRLLYKSVTLTYKNMTNEELEKHKENDHLIIRYSLTTG